MADGRLVLPQFVVFIAGGLLSAAVDIGAMQLLTYQGMGALAATSAGFAVGLMVNFAFHAKITFNSIASPGRFARFMCVVGINYLITIGFVALAVALSAPALAGKIASLPVVAINGYFISKHWIFK